MGYDSNAKTSIFSVNGQKIYCEAFNCRNYASWFVGKQSGPRELLLNLCDDCVKDMLNSLPDELGKVEFAVDAEEEYKPEYACDQCDSVFDNPRSLHSHKIAKHRTAQKAAQKAAMARYEA